MVSCEFQKFYQISVEWKQDESVDGSVGGDVDQVLHDLAPEVVQRPAHSIVDGGRRNASHDEQQVSCCQVLQKKRNNLLKYTVYDPFTDGDKQLK